MKYKIYYQTGLGKEKIEIAKKVRSITEISLEKFIKYFTSSNQIKTLQLNYQKILLFDEKLLSPEIKSSSVIILNDSNIEELILKYNELLQLKEKIIIKKNEKIPDSDKLVEIDSLIEQFESIFLYLKNQLENLEKFNEAIAKIFATHGSSIDDFYMTADEFSSGLKISTSEPKHEEDSDFSDGDFM